MNDSVKQVAEPKLNKKSKATTWILCSVVAVIVLIWFVPPIAAEMYLSKNINKFINADTTNNVDLKANTFQLLAGKFNSFEINGSNLMVGNLTVKSYSLKADKGQIDIFKTLKQHKIELKDSPVITLDMNVAISDMAKLLQGLYKSLNEMTVQGRDGYLQISGVSGTQKELNLPIKFKLKLTNKDWSSLQASAYDFEIATDKQIPEEVINQLEVMYTKTILFNNTNPPIYINSVVVKEDGINITSNSALN
ncbi:hypothetical protein IMX26_09235 [Clostridium sp. 'deep sea']|uniref:LmeA family phospholipid-binding protein n=1 Tax=Clostridium sp. 'deep sea' TaxID=2779445 RepID=UPI0018966D76|nr:LmeA family phospholipid-binding protein [Clostridium sp. 'deep sea']QOR33685.1 hypothetical protein IMX26_09235 [Clostridium sp. 'deep sea']